VSTLFSQLTAEQEAALKQRLADAPRNQWLGSGKAVTPTSATPPPAAAAPGRRRPAYNPQTRRHTWDDLAHGHRCGHCGLGKLSVQAKPGDNRSWFTVWVDLYDGRRGSTLLHGETPGLVRGPNLPDCPGPRQPTEGAAP
jgi:hypothetical protein